MLHKRITKTFISEVPSFRFRIYVRAQVVDGFLSFAVPLLSTWIISIIYSKWTQLWYFRVSTTEPTLVVAFWMPETRESLTSTLTQIIIWRLLAYRVLLQGWRVSTPRLNMVRLEERDTLELRYRTNLGKWSLPCAMTKSNLLLLVRRQKLPQ